MKLTQHQIEALARELAKKEEARIRAHNTTVLKDKKLVAEAKRIHKIIQSLPKVVKEAAFEGIKYVPTENTILGRLAKKSGKLKDAYYRYNSFVDKISIASIDASTMDELKGKLKID